MIFDRIFGRTTRRERQEAAARTYVALVDAARRPEFYTDVGIPDTIDGRFELVVLHAFLILDRLQWRPEVSSSEISSHADAGDSVHERPAHGGTAEISGESVVPKDDGVDQEFAQVLFDYMFADMDHNLREMGVGDMSVGKRVRKMGEAFYGRAVSYQKALETDRRDDLHDALRRNLFGTLPAPSTTAVAMMADYVTNARHHLRNQHSTDIRSAQIVFPPPPEQVQP